MTQSRTLLLVPLLGLLWGFNWAAVRIALIEIAPWTLRSGGMAFAGLALVAVALLRGLPLCVPRTDWLPLLVAASGAILPPSGRRKMPSARQSRH